MKPSLLVLGLALGAAGLPFVACGGDESPLGGLMGLAGSGGRGGGAGATQGRGGESGDGGGAGGAAGSAAGGAGGAAPAARPIVYQLVVRHFGNRSTGRVKGGTIEENGVGKFVDVSAAALGSLKELGVTHVWYTGVLRQATLTDYSALDPRLAASDPDIVKGRAGSFYAVRDYYDVSPDYAIDPARRLDEFDALVRRTREAGLKVLIDLVPNHVARDYGSVVRPEADFGSGDDRTQFFSLANDFFYLPGAGPLALAKPASWQPPGFSFDGAFAPEDGSPGRLPRATGNNVAAASPAEGDWYDTVKLNYGVNFLSPAAPPAGPLPAWQKMNAVIEFWQKERGVDGFRCDFAHYVPDEAWRYLIGEARKRDPGAYFLAEAYDNLAGLLADGFDAVYHDRLYDTLRSMYRGKAAPVDLRALYGDLSVLDRPRYASYLENHDECRLAAADLCDCQKPPEEGCDGPAFYSADAVRQLGPLAYLAGSGPVLIYNGQEVGEDGTGDEGFGGEDAHTSIFDYWSVPSLQKWANGGVYDGAGLSAEQRALRGYYGELLALAKSPLVRGGGFRELMTANPGVVNVFPFARYDASEPGKLLVVVVNFAPGQAFEGEIKLPADLLDAAGVAGGAPKAVKLVFDRLGPVASPQAQPTTREGLIATGLRANVPNQAGLVYLVE